jgi:GT2 family glycosyltransferase
VIDNASAESDRALLRQIIHSEVRIAELGHNKGFAAGYNAAARLAQDAFDPEFFVVMNPDVDIVNRGTIETLIGCIRAGGTDVVGAQPLIYNYRLPESVTKQPAIRRIPDVWDLVISESIILRYVFRNRFRKFLMLDARPYGRNTRFFVPSGAFFVMRAQEFYDIGGFDERTFLYGEEFILGKKLEQRNKHFSFEPSVTVRHFQGAATGFERWRPNRRMYIFRRDSQIYYVREYLGGGWFQRSCLWAAAELGYLIRVLVWMLRNAGRLVKRGSGASSPDE